MPNYLSRYDIDTLPSLEQCVLFKDGRVYFTPVGIQRYAERFARAGFDIAKINTVEEFGIAERQSFHIEMECLTEVLQERRPERMRNSQLLKWLDASRVGNKVEADRLEREMKEADRRRMSVTTASNDASLGDTDRSPDA